MLASPKTVSLGLDVKADSMISDNCRKQNRNKKYLAIPVIHENDNY